MTRSGAGPGAPTPQRRGRGTRILRVLAGLVVLSLLGAGLTWGVARPDVSWSTQLPGGGWRVLDADADRVLLEGLDEVALLDRADGEVLRLLRASAGQGWLVPGGGFLTVSQDEDLLQAWDDDPSDRDDTQPTTLWEQTGEGVRLHGATAEVVAVSGLRPGMLLGVAPTDGSPTWSVEVDDVLTGISPGWVQDDLDVVAATVRGRPQGVLLSVVDGTAEAELPLGGDDVRRGAGASPTVVVWGDRALVVDGDRASSTSAAGSVDLDLPPGIVPASQAGGVVTVDGPEGAVAVDLSAGTVSALPDAAEDPTFGAETWQDAYDDHQVDDRTTVVPIDGVLTGVDRGTGEVLFTLPEEGAGLAQGRQAALVVREPSGWDAWLERLAGLGDDPLGELQVVDRDGDLHGSVLTDVDDVEDRAVLDGHEAVVVLRDPDDGDSRVLLLGR